MLEFHTEAPHTTVSEGLAQGLERDSNSRPYGRKASNLPMSHHAPKIVTGIPVTTVLLCIVQLFRPWFLS